MIPQEGKLRSTPAKKKKKRRKSTGRPVMLDRFEVLEQLAVGAKGAVYRGRDSKSGDTVAIRAIPTGLVERLVARDRWFERFSREASTAAAINHTNLTAILEHGFDEERRCLYLVTEFVEGSTIEKRLAQEGAFETSEALAMACRVSEALTAVHGGGCVHGLVDPSNVVAEKNGDFKLTDFGLNSLLGWDLMPLRDRLGEPPYLSPEQLRLGRIDDRSDQFSLGLVLYEALTGDYPFSGQSTAKKVQNILTTKARIELEDSSELGEVLERMLSNAPEDRFQGDAELNAALARCAEGLP